MNTMYSILVGLSIVLAVGGLVVWQTQDDAMETPVPDFGTSIDSDQAGGSPSSSDDFDDDVDEVEDGAGGNSGAGGSTGGSTSGITAAVVAQHNTRASCWSSINGNVYDLTSWIPKHPGGEQAILQLCGIDGSAKFNGQHGGAPQQATVLAGFKIGTLQ